MQFVIAVIRSGFRSRSFHSVLALGLAVVVVAFLAASFSPRHPQTVALDVGLSGLRFALVLMGLFWVQDFVSREVERKTVLHGLSYPVARSQYLLGRLAGILLLLMLAALLLSLLLMLAVVNTGGGYEQEFPVYLGPPYWATIGGLLLGVWVITSFAFFLASLSTVSFLPLALGVAFAIAAQSLGAVSQYLAGGADGQTALVERYAPIVAVVRWVLPDLSRLDWRDWPMYGIQPGATDVLQSVLMAIAYGTAMYVLAAIVFRKRDFT